MHIMSEKRFCFGKLYEFFKKIIVKKFAQFKYLYYLCTAFSPRKKITLYIYGNVHY